MASGMYAEQSRILVLLLAEALPADVEAREDVAYAFFATLIGTLQLARAVNNEVSGRILQAGKNALRALAGLTHSPAS